MDRPEGESLLAELEQDWEAVEGELRALIVMAVEGDRARILVRALDLLHRLRDPDRARLAITRAYRYAARAAGAREPTRGGAGRLAGALAYRLGRAVDTASTNTREAVRTVTAATVPEAANRATVAHVDRRGTSWQLAAYAAMQSQTLGRVASTTGLTDHLEHGARVEIAVSGCDYCSQYAGVHELGAGPLPPFHPSCTCVATRAA